MEYTMALASKLSVVVDRGQTRQVTPFGRMLVGTRLRPLDLTISQAPQNSDTTVANMPPVTTGNTLTLAEYLRRNYMAVGSKGASACNNDVLQGGRVNQSAVAEVQALMDTQKVAITEVMKNKSYIASTHPVINH